MNAPEMLDSLRTLVEHESPSLDKPRLDVLARLLAGRFEAMNGQVDVIANPSGGDHVRARFFGSAAKPALLLAHFDTVWPAGTLATMPFREENGVAYGPGVFDMKASLVIAEFTIKHLIASGNLPARPVEILMTSDEEVGSPTSRRWIEERAREAEYVLVLEPPLPDGSLKTERKGVGAFELEVEGRPAHAGVEPHKGRSAVLELAHQILHLHALNDPAAGTTVNVGVVEGGTTPNVVPARARARIDVRARTLAEAAKVEQAIRSLKPVLEGTSVTIQGQFNRPPMERTPQVAGLFARVQRVARQLGVELTEGSTGGGSDGNFTAALGLPTVDGLGAAGAGAHASHEQVVLASLPERVNLLSALLREL
jgi:glutamate carboxypeptidase